MREGNTMDRIAQVLVGIALFLGPGVAAADVLELKNGSRLEGSFRGADAHSIQFDANDEVHLIPIEQAHSLVFGDTPDSTRGPGKRAPAPPAHSQRPAPASHPKLAQSSATAAGTTPPAQASSTPAASAPAATTVEIPLGTLVRVRIADTVDPRIGAQGDRFAGLLDTGLTADGVTVIPARTRVYGVVSEARTQGPIASRLKLELTGVMLSGEMLPVVSGTHNLVEPPGPAKAAPVRADRIPAGSVLEFRLLQSVKLVRR
jgi:hypothetical protein